MEREGKEGRGREGTWLVLILLLNLEEEEEENVLHVQRRCCRPPFLTDFVHSCSSPVDGGGGGFVWPLRVSCSLLL